MSAAAAAVAGEEARCGDCGGRIEWFYVTLQGRASCVHCGCVRALAILDPHGPLMVSAADLEQAARVVRWAALILPRQRLAAFRRRLASVMRRDAVVH